MTLASTGFLIVGVLFAIYAYTFYSLAEKKLPAFLRNYAYAYGALALAFLMWSYSTFNRHQFTTIGTSIMIGDCLILLGSLFLLSVLFHERKGMKSFAVFLGVLCSLAFVYERTSYFRPMPLFENGILIFNTQGVIAIVLGLIFACIWLPANIRVANIIGQNMNVRGVSSVYSFMYVLSTVAAILFISVDTPLLVVLSFIVLGLCFAMLLYSNYVVGKIVSGDIGAIPRKPATPVSNQ